MNIKSFFGIGPFPATGGWNSQQNWAILELKKCLANEQSKKKNNISYN